MKILNVLVVMALAVTFIACKTTQKITKSSTPKNVQLISQLKGCKDSLSIYEFNGISFKKLQNMETLPGDSFRIVLPQGAPKFYYIGSETNRKRPVILGTEADVYLSGNCNNMRSSKFANSSINVAYDDLMRKINISSSNMNKVAREFQKNIHDEQKRKEAIATMAKIDTEKKQLLDSLKLNHPFLAKVAALNTYLSFQNNNNSRFKNELDYFGKAYFDFADFKDADYNNIPYVFEAFKNWSKTLSLQKVPEQMVQSYFDSTLVQIPADSRAYKYALGGIVTSLQAKNHPLFASYGSRYLEKYGSDKGPAMDGLRKKINMAGSFMTGAVAPDFTQKTPEGEELSLSDLRGKVVLVDFWASWCGPCRRENPHVVRLYNQYKDRGFDVLGVSLDRSKAPWLKAIKKDALPWHHVSDLRGWKNEVAQMYSVSSIPHTLLLDREGRIIARNLRGHQLDKELKKIFGN